MVVTTHDQSRLTFWPLPPSPPQVVDGYKAITRPVAFSPDGRWLASTWAGQRLRLWPLPGSGSTEVRTLDGTVPAWTRLAFDPQGRFLFGVGIGDSAWIIPLDGSPARKLGGESPGIVQYGAAVSPSGRRVASAFWPASFARCTRACVSTRQRSVRCALMGTGITDGIVASNKRLELTKREELCS